MSMKGAAYAVILFALCIGPMITYLKQSFAEDVLNYYCQRTSSFERSVIDASSFKRFAVHQMTPISRLLPGSFRSFQSAGYHSCHSASSFIHPCYWSWETPIAPRSHIYGCFLSLSRSLRSLKNCDSSIAADCIDEVVELGVSACARRHCCC